MSGSGQKSDSPTVGLVLLAAGESCRMGTPKQALPFGETTLLGHAVKTALASSCRPVIVALGAFAETLIPLVEPFSVGICIVSDWQEGMNAAIREGLKVLLIETPELDAVLLMTCDQPALTPALLEALIEAQAQTGKPVAASTYGKTFGIPLVFAASLFEGLKTLPPGAGAKKWVSSLPSDHVVFVPFPGGENDLDTPDDYKLFLKNSTRP